MATTYKIGEAAALLNLKAYVLRFWETEFAEIEPLRSDKGQRLYTQEHLALLERIRFLLHERGLTIDGARKALVEDKERGTLYTFDLAGSAPDKLGETEPAEPEENGGEPDTAQKAEPREDYNRSFADKSSSLEESPSSSESATPADQVDARQQREKAPLTGITESDAEQDSFENGASALIAAVTAASTALRANSRAAPPLEAEQLDDFDEEPEPAGKTKILQATIPDGRYWLIPPVDFHYAQGQDRPEACENLLHRMVSFEPVFLRKGASCLPPLPSVEDNLPEKPGPALFLEIVSELENIADCLR